MKKLFFLSITLISISIYSQNSKFSLKYNYGLNIALQSELIGVCTDCNANTIGTVGNLELEYKISNTESLGFGVNMTENKNKNEFLENIHLFMTFKGNLHFLNCITKKTYSIQKNYL